MENFLHGQKKNAFSDCSKQCNSQGIDLPYFNAVCAVEEPSEYGEGHLHAGIRSQVANIFKKRKNP